MRDLCLQTKASWYAAVRDHLASWGYIIVQYDTPRWRIPSISDELEEFPVILSWLERENQREGSPLHGRVNTSCIATAGHSRGGKLACLLYTKYESIQSAWLIDPVDGLDRAAPSEDNPSALHALEASSRKRIGISGAGILSSCNAGKEGNFVSFYNSSGHGSWVATLPQASHSSFADGGSIINLLQDIVCGKSRIKRKLVEKINTAMMLTWFQIALDGPPQGVPDPILKFRSWIERVQDQEGLVNFEVKSPKLEYQLA